MDNQNQKIKYASKKIERISNEISRLSEMLNKKSSMQDVLINFAIYSKFEMDMTDEKGVFVEDVGRSVYGATGPITVEGKDIFLKTLDSDIEPIEKLGDYFDDFNLDDPKDVENLLDKRKEAQGKWEELKERINNFFEKVVPQEKKDEYHKLLEEINSI